MSELGNFLHDHTSLVSQPFVGERVFTANTGTTIVAMPQLSVIQVMYVVWIGCNCLAYSFIPSLAASLDHSCTHTCKHTQNPPSHAQSLSHTHSIIASPTTHVHACPHSLAPIHLLFWLTDSWLPVWHQIGIYSVCVGVQAMCDTTASKPWTDQLCDVAGEFQGQGTIDCFVMFCKYYNIC